MKKLLTLILYCIPAFVAAQDSIFTEIMKKTISTMDTSSTKYGLHYSANTFERIGNTIKSEWLPFYYCAYCYVKINYMVKDDDEKDLYIDKATDLIFIAEQIDPNNSEIFVMKGFILQARMKVDPMTRGFKYNSDCLSMFQKAKELDPENPRSYLWHGVNLLNTPKFFGGGKDEALPLLKKSIEKFDSFKPKSDIHPNWGRPYAEEMIAKCSK
ncbi:MAG: hypothetical protein EHM93_00560 [Bacteroidales bacterium]|nr:MAG: hypothetical protein EHM93_00560 [Bacteroidales bacterium]